MKNYIKEIEEFISLHEDGEIEVSPGVSYLMRSINNESSRLFAGQFASGKVEESGFVRAFMRKAFVVHRTLIQNADLDLKHMNIRSVNGVKVRLTALIKMAFISHLSRSFFGEILDKILNEMCWFGSSIVKRVDGEIYTVALKNYITESSVQNPQERRHLEMCSYTYDQMLSHKKDWKGSWDAVEAVWKEMQEQGESKFKVLEFWTFNEEGNKICVKALDNTITSKREFHDATDWSPFIQLDVFRTPYKRERMSKRMQKRLGKMEDIFPYEQFDLFKVFGRQQAMGVAELLADISIVYNTIFNTTVKNVQKAQMGIHVHNAVQGVDGLTELLQENIANLLEGGVVSMSPGESIQNFPWETRIQDFDLLENKLYELMRQLIGITAQGTGEEMPASTSATQASINQQTANTVYDYVQERMHHGMKRLFNNGYADDIWNEIDENELTAIIGDPTQLEELDKFYVDNAMNKWALDTKKATGMYPSQEEFDQAKEIVHQELMDSGDMRYPAIKKKLAKDMDLLIEFDMTGESVDTKGRFDALLAMKNDPTSTKSKARIEDEILNLQNLNPRNYDKSSEELEREAEAMIAEQQANMPQQAPNPLMQ